MEATRTQADHMLEKAKSDIANEQEKATRDAQAKDRRACFAGC